MQDMYAIWIWNIRKGKYRIKEAEMEKVRQVWQFGIYTNVFSRPFPNIFF